MLSLLPDETDSSRRSRSSPQRKQVEPDAETDALVALHHWLLAEDSKADMKLFPKLPQKHFVHLWKTLHDMFLEPSGNPAVVDFDVQRLYHAVSLVGTLLLQIGEVGQKVKREKAAKGQVQDREEGEKEIKESVEELLADAIDEVEEKEERSKVTDDSDWSVTFEQFLASVLNESVLVDYFDRKIDLRIGLEKINLGRLTRQESNPATTAGSSVFYV